MAPAGRGGEEVQASEHCGRLPVAADPALLQTQPTIAGGSN
jgi:hypothetical protein